MAYSANATKKLDVAANTLWPVMSDWEGKWLTPVRWANWGPPKARALAPRTLDNER